MFINTAEFPPIKEGKEDKFIKWFQWSNSVYKNFKGFISRKLLKSDTEPGKYVGLVEHESKETFMVMYHSPKRQKASEKVFPILEGNPKAKFFNVILTEKNH
ncbi:MAG: antibiotic biosynthesis monooxygenase [Ignavibacteria bacterium]|jgi:heme-degrading monooxygenase HmoA